MSDWVNLAIGATIIALTGVAALGGVVIGAAGEATTLGMLAVSVSITGVGLLVAALGIQTYTSANDQPAAKIQVREDDQDAAERITDL